MFVLFADATDAHSSEIYNAAVGDDSTQRPTTNGLRVVFTIFFYFYYIFVVFSTTTRPCFFSSLSLFQTNGHLLLLFRRSVAYYRNGVQFSIYSKTSFLTFFFFYMPVRPVFIHPNEQRFLLYGDLRFPLPISFMDIMTRKWPLAKAVYIEHQVLYNSSTIIYILPRLSSSASSLSLSALFTHIRLILSMFSTLQRRPSKRPSKLLCILIWMANGWEDVVSEISWRL